MLTEISLTSFRNFENQIFTFEKGLNLIIGPNGSGKTNILEAIGYISQAKSFRRAADKDIITWGKEFFRIEATVEKDGTKHNISISYELETASKKILVNNKPVEKTSILFSLFPSLISTDRDQDIIDGYPVERRNMINRLISIANPEYMNLMLDYRKVIENKNVLLREQKTKELKPWNQKQDDLSSRIVSYRREFIERMREPFGTLSKEFLNNKKADIYFSPSLDGSRSLDELIKEELEAGFSIYGPHRDSIDFLIDERPAKIFGSEGEKRLIILAFYFTFLDIYKPESMVILDEPFSVLDRRGTGIVLSHLLNQTFISAPFIYEGIQKFEKVLNL